MMEKCLPGKRLPPLYPTSTKAKEDVRGKGALFQED